MYRIRCSFITLVEVLIVLTILIMASAAVGINVMKSLKEQRFRMEVEQIVDTFRLSQDLMLIMNTDVRVHFVTTDQKGFEYWMDVEGGIPKQWEPLIKNQRRHLDEIHGIFFHDLQAFPFVEGQLTIHFESAGSLMSKGLFRVSTHDREDVPGALIASICLKGYPHPLASIIENENIPPCENTEDDSFNDKLTFSTVREILEDNDLIKTLTPSSKENSETKNSEAAFSSP